MIGYKDRSYCGSDVKVHTCGREFTEQEERSRVVGHCDECATWYKFTDDPEDPSVRLCPLCGGNVSSRVGYQITTQRTFNPKAKKMTKAELKRFSGA